MKSFILVLSCLVAASMTCGYEVDTGEILRRTTELNDLYNSLEPSPAIITLSDLYYYTNGASDDEKSQNDKTIFLSWLDILANWIAEETNNPRIYVELLEQTKKQIRILGYMIDKTRQDMWMGIFRPNQPFEYTYEKSEEEFRGQLKRLSKNRSVNTHAVVEALIDGKGVCSYFEYSDKSTLTDRKRNLSKIVYLLQVFSDRNLFHLMVDQRFQISAILKLSKYCEKLRERGSLTEERRNSFLFSVLNEQFDRPIAELPSYVSGSQEICELLKLNGNYPMLGSPTLGSVFLKDCLIYLADRFTKFLRKQDPTKIGKLIEVANSSWYKEVKDFLKNKQKMINNQESRKLDLEKLLRQHETVDMLNHRTDGSFTIQTILEDKDFAEIEHFHRLVERNMRPEEYQFMIDMNGNLETLNRFCNLSNICLNYYTGRDIVRPYREAKRPRFV